MATKQNSLNKSGRINTVKTLLMALLAGVKRLRAFIDSIRAGYQLGQLLGPIEALRTAAHPQALAADNRAQGGTNLVGLIIGIVVAAIVGIAVGIPVIQDAIAQANVSGTTALIVGFIPVMIGLMIFVATASPIMRRM